MFYIVKDEELKLYDDNLEKLVTTLELSPQLKDELLLETDIITATELELHPNKVIIGDIEIEVNVQEYDEEGNPIMIIIEEEVKVPKTHKEVATVRGLVLNPNYEKEEAEKRRIYLDSLELTASDVERAIYEAKDMDFDDLLQFVIDKKIAGFDIKRLKIELKANHFIRKHPYINMIGELLGYTPDDMDYLFENKQLPIKSKEDENDLV